MRRFILLCLLMFTVSSVVFAQRMTDEQVIQYVQEAQQAGKTQQQMSIELMKKGVTKEQIQRIQSKYSGKTDVSAGVEKSDSRLRTPQKYENKNKNISQNDSELSNANSKKQTIKGLRAKTDKNKQRDGGEMESELELDGEEQTDYLGYDNLFAPTKVKKEKKEDPTQQIFGHNIFDNEYLTFEPNINVATPNNYRLGAGDEVIIDVWGASQTTIRETISPEGTVQIENLGPVYLGGKTVKEANTYLKNEFAKIYAGVTGETPNTR